MNNPLNKAAVAEGFVAKEDFAAKLQEKDVSGVNDALYIVVETEKAIGVAKNPDTKQALFFIPKKVYEPK